jgi:murein DD-endopeptidase MepM/ murein hydrolase activator NlpD
LKQKKDISSKLSNLKAKHKLSFTDETTYDEKWSFNLSRLNIWSLFFLYSFLLIFGVFVLIRFTPVKSLFIDNTNLYELNQNLTKNSAVIDSLEFKIKSNESYLNDFKKIITGESLDEFTIDSTNTIPENYKPDFSKNEVDSILRSKIENNDIEVNDESSKNIGFFMSPVNGIISHSFNKKEKHFGIDVVTQKDEPIKAALDGVVIFSNWTSTEGNVLIIKHHDNYISSYKHCSILLKELGDYVEIGDPIGIVGNSGKYTDGPHLHFEIWQNNSALDPQEFISF